MWTKVKNFFVRGNRLPYLYEYNSDFGAFIIYKERPMPKPYKSPITEYFTLNMDKNAFNELTVRELLRELNE